MVWQIKPFSHRCYITGEPFEPGDRYVSYLTAGTENETLRFDVSADREGEFSPEGEVICKWRQEYKKEAEKDESANRQKATAENLFFSLFEEEEPEPEDAVDDGDAGDGAGEDAAGEPEADGPIRGEEREAMKKFLCLFLERRRILKNRGRTPDGKFLIMEHMKSRNIFMVPAGDLEPAEVMRIGERLGALVK